MEIMTSERNGVDESFSFSNKSIRMAFIRKVYGILMVQLAITVGCIALFIYEPHLKNFHRSDSQMFWISFATAFGTKLLLLSVLGCCGRRWPLNIILLNLFTLCKGYILGAISSFCQVEDVLIAGGVCTAVCFALTIFAMQNKFNFTASGGICLVCAIIFLTFGIVGFCIPGHVIPLLRLTYSLLGALIYSIYLVIDTHLMVGDERKYSITPEEYIFAALTLYLDIVNIFSYILKIVGGLCGN